MSTLSTHVLDTSRGRPAEGIGIALSDAHGQHLGDGVTSADGRVESIGPQRLPAGTYRLTFATGSYFEAQGEVGFYPEVVIVFTIAEATEHYHVPLLLNPFGYSTYRGS